MQTKPFRRRTDWTSLSLLLGLALSVFTNGSVRADFVPADCQANNLALNIGLAPGQNGFVAVGQNVTFVVSLLNPFSSFSGKSCDAYGMTVTFNCPDASGGCATLTQTLGTGLVLAPPPVDGAPSQLLVGTITCVVSANPGVTVLKACTDVTAGFSHNGPVSDGAFVRHSEQPLTVRRPAICVSKSCDSATVNAAGQVVVNFSGFVTNCGDETLINIQVVNNQPAPNTVVATIPSLAPGAVLPYSGVYTNTGSICGPFPDTITATGTGLDTSSSVSASASAQCTITYTPCIRVIKTCIDTEVQAGTPIRYSYIVTNCGNIALQNVVAVDNSGTPGLPGDDVSNNIGNLAVGEVKGPFTGTIPTSEANCVGTGFIDNTVVVTGASVCPPNQTVTDDDTCRAHVSCRPDITVDKTVACAPPSGNCDGSLTYANTATGIQGAAFCYKITVCNPPTAGEPLVNLVVRDDDLGGILSGFPSTLAIGQCATAYFQKTWPVSGNPATFVNTVRASGVGAGSGISTNDTDDATVRLLPIGVECKITLSSAMDAGGPCDVDLPDGTVDAPVRFILELSNTGDAAVNVTGVSGLPALVDCDTGVPIVPVFPIALAVGETKSIVGCVLVSCPGGAQYTVSAHAEVDDQGGTICVYKSDGTKVSTDSTPCTACVGCVPIVDVSCRVTGGGVLIPGFVDQSCIEVNTTIFPFTSPNGLTINKITHGGQLGAPFSQMDCGAILGNPCIRGQWSHTRHYEGTANPRDVFDMNFHSQTPKGVYDSLSCVCLGCCDPGTGAFIPPSLGPLVHKFQICNPDDHKVCGPMPRPAPANAIIWSGIGKVTPTDDVRGSRAAQAEWVVFRVYIEDRSEPGGGHPGGAVEPADIYCFQAWKTGIKVSKKPDFTTIATLFRQALGEANCDFLAALESGALPIGSLPSPTVGGVTADIQDCGPMHDGNHQIHPSTGATCTE